MSTRFVFVLAVILSYAGVFFIFRRKNLSFFAGYEYLLLGFIISILGADISMLKPALYPVLGWVGLLLGLQLKIHYLMGLERSFYVKVVVFGVAVPLLLSLFLFFIDYKTAAFVGGIALSSISYKTAAHFIPFKRRDNRFVLFFVSFLPFVSVMIFFIYTSLIQDLIITGYSIILIVLFSILIRASISILEDRGSVILLLIGYILLTSEICAVLSISPLLVSFFIGIYLTNFSHWKEFIFKALYTDEKQLYALFLILLGLISGLNISQWVFVYGLLIALMAASVKYLVFRTEGLGFSNHKWFHFLAPGGFAIAVMTDYWLISGGARQTIWFSSFLISALVLQFTAIMASKKRGKKQ